MKTNEEIIHFGKVAKEGDNLIFESIKKIRAALSVFEKFRVVVTDKLLTNTSQNESFNQIFLCLHTHFWLNQYTNCGESTELANRVCCNEDNRQEENKINQTVVNDVIRHIK